jgi:hypothetical protein
MKARLGTPKAITATAPKLARLIYAMLQHGTVYVRQNLAAYEQQYRDRIVQSLTRRAKAWGDTLVKRPEETPAEPARPLRSSLEGPRLSRDKRPLSADLGFFPRREPGAVLLWPRVLA